MFLTLPLPLECCLSVIKANQTKANYILQLTDCKSTLSSSLPVPEWRPCLTECWCFSVPCGCPPEPTLPSLPNSPCRPLGLPSVWIFPPAGKGRPHTIQLLKSLELDSSEFSGGPKTSLLKSLWTEFKLLNEMNQSLKSRDTITGLTSIVFYSPTPTDGLEDIPEDPSVQNQHKSVPRFSKSKEPQFCPRASSAPTQWGANQGVVSPSAFLTSNIISAYIYSR